ncbi:UNVERIFIED_CONTAM: hypothetical protein NCL1_16310 [Trichonephila clavipes]
MLYHGNASFHTARLTAEFLKQKQIKVKEHSPYSPDLAIYINDWFQEFNLWKIRLQKCIDTRVYYFEES